MHTFILTWGYQVHSLVRRAIRSDDSTFHVILYTNYCVLVVLVVHSILWQKTTSTEFCLLAVSTDLCTADTQ